MNAEQEEQTAVVIKYNSWLLRVVKTHGLSVALMLSGLYFLNGRLEVAEKKIATVEARLYDCYEKRITADNSRQKPEDTGFRKFEFILPEKQKRKNDYTLL